MKILDRLPLHLLGFGLMLLPIIMSVNTMDPVLMPRFTVLAGLLFGVSIALFLHKTKAGSSPFLGSKMAWPFWIFLLSGLAAAFVALNTVEAFYFLGRDALFITFMLLVMDLCRGELKAAMILLRYLSLGAAVVIVFGVIQYIQVYLQGDGELDLYLVRSTLAHRNLLVSALVLYAPFLGYQIYREKGFWRWFSLLLLSFSALLIALLQSRTGWLAILLLTGSFVGILLLGISPIRKWKLPVKGMMVATIVLGLGAFLSYYTLSPEVEANAELTGGLGYSDPTVKDFTADERIFMWEATTRMINDQSLLGVGPGNWKIWFPKYGSDIWRSRQGLAQFQRPHNDYLWVLAEQGIVGLMAYAFIFLFAIYCGLSLFFDSSRGQPIRLLAALLVSGLLAYLTISIFSFPRERIIHQLLLFLNLGLIFSLYFGDDNQNKPRRSIPALIGLIVTPLLLYMGYQRIVGERYTKELLAYRANSQWQLMANRAESMEPFSFYNMDPTSVPFPFYRGLAHLSLEQYPQAVAELHQAYDIHPYNIHVVNNLASAYQLEGDPSKAIHYYEEALKISPKYLDGALNLIAAYFNFNQVNESYLLLRKYHGLFQVDGKDDPRYTQYLEVVLQTLSNNLADAQSAPELKESLLTMESQALMDLHGQSLQDDISFESVLLEYSRKKLKDSL